MTNTITILKFQYSIQHKNFTQHQTAIQKHDIVKIDIKTRLTVDDDDDDDDDDDIDNDE